MRDDTVEAGICRTLKVKVTLTDVVDCFVVEQERTVRVLEGGVGRQDRVVRLYDSS